MRADQYLAGTGGMLKARSDVDRMADDGVLRPLHGAETAVHDLPAIHAEAEPVDIQP